MARIPLDEWLQYAPDKPGRVRVNHNSSDCTGGRESMIVDRREDGTASAVCFRCGNRGYHSPVRHFKSPRKADDSGLASPVVSSGSRCTPPRDATGEWSAFPREAREWLMAGGVSAVISSEQGFLWSEEKQRLWIPVRQYSKVTTGSKLVGYVERGFSPKSYLTRTDNKEGFYGYYVSDSGVITNTKIVIVEDVISALKCSQVVDSIAITGVHPKLDALSTILKNGYKEVYIFLDADNPTVRMKAREIPKRLPFVVCKIIETGKDPKHHSIEEIQELIK